MPIVIAPVGDKLCIELAPKETLSEGGIHLPDIAQEDARIGTVVAAGPGKIGPTGVRVPPMPQAGDTVLISKYGLQTCKVGSTEFYFAGEEAIYAILYRRDDEEQS